MVRYKLTMLNSYEEVMYNHDIQEKLESLLQDWFPVLSKTFLTFFSPNFECYVFFPHINFPIKFSTLPYALSHLFVCSVQSIMLCTFPLAAKPLLLSKLLHPYVSVCVYVRESVCARVCFLIFPLSPVLLRLSHDLIGLPFQALTFFPQKTLNLNNIATNSQYHQHLMLKFFIQKCLAKLFSSNILAL